MAADGESTGKPKGRAGRRDGADIGEFVEKDRRLGINELETIPTMVPLLLIGIEVAESHIVSCEKKLPKILDIPDMNQRGSTGIYAIDESNTNKLSHT